MFNIDEIDVTSYKKLKFWTAQAIKRWTYYYFLILFKTIKLAFSNYNFWAKKSNSKGSIRFSSLVMQSSKEKGVEIEYKIKWGKQKKKY